MMKPAVALADFAKLDLRVGLVEDVWDVDGSSKLYRMLVDLGPDFGKKTIFAGVKPWYRKLSLKNKSFVFVANLEPRRMMGSESQGMMLAADGEEKPVLVPVSKAIKPGAALK